MNAEACYVEIRDYRCRNWKPVAFFTSRAAAEALVAKRSANDAANRVTCRIRTGRA